MKVRASLLLIAIATLVITPSASAIQSKKLAFKLSVILPEHASDTSEYEFGERRTTRIIRAPQDQIVVEQTLRNDEKVILKTAVVK